MKENIIADKSKQFALRIIKLYRYLCDEKEEYILSKQLLRSGTASVPTSAKLYRDKANLISTRNFQSP